MSIKFRTDGTFGYKKRMALYKKRSQGGGCILAIRNDRKISLSSSGNICGKFN